MGKSFSISRMAHVIVWLFGNNKRRLGVLMGVMLGVLGFETVVNMLGDFYQFAYHHVLIQAANMGMTMILLLLLLAPSFIMRKLNRTDRAVEFFSLPASVSEKYVASWIFIVLGGALAFIGGFLVYDVVQFLLTTVLLPGHAEWATSYVVYNITWSTFPALGDSVEFWGALSGVLMIIWIQSVYALGGTLFRRFQWLIVTLFFFALLIGLALFVKEQLSASRFEIFFDAKPHLMFLCAAFMVLTILNYWLSFRCFKRSQVINNRWVNS